MKKTTLIMVASLILLGGIGSAMYTVFANSGPRAPVVIKQFYRPEIPQLTEAERAKVQQIALNDIRVRELIDKRRYVIKSTGVWVTTQHEKIGGFIEISFEKPFFVEGNWPVIEYDEEKHGEVYYSEGAVHEALWVKKLNIRVDLRKGRVVDITPLPFG